MRCELWQESTEGPFTAALFRQETHWWDDESEVIDKIISTTEVSAPLTGIYDELERWLRAEYHLRVIPSSWESGETGPDTGVVVLMEATCAPIGSYSADLHLYG